MEHSILLPDVDAVKRFVYESSACNSTVLVSKEGFNYMLDGSSIIGMMNMIGAKLRVKYYGDSLGLLGLINQYSC